MPGGRARLCLRLTVGSQKVVDAPASSANYPHVRIKCTCRTLPLGEGIETLVSSRHFAGRVCPRFG